jgi:hypothetical protein
MPNRIYHKVELVGTSTESADDAIRRGVAAAARRYPHVDWFEVVETRGHVEDGKIGHFQVVLKIGYRTDDEA